RQRLRTGGVQRSAEGMDAEIAAGVGVVRGQDGLSIAAAESGCAPVADGNVVVSVQRIGGEGECRACGDSARRCRDLEMRGRAARNVGSDVAEGRRTRTGAGADLVVVRGSGSQ